MTEATVLSDVERDQHRPSGRSRPAHAGAQRRSTVAVVGWGAVAFLVVVGIALRLWFLAHVPINSDAAVAGLMGQQILHGHFTTFFWGQYYGGVEPYVVAVMVWVLGPNGWVLGATASLLAAAASLVLWRIARRLLADPLLAALAGALSWAGSETVVKNSTVEWGFRGAALLLGLTCLLFAVRVHDGELGWWNFAGLGLTAGLGWWASPEFVYLALPSALFLVTAVVRAARTRASADASAGPRLAGPRLAGPRLAGRLGLAVAAAVLGALPWLWTGTHNGFKALQRGTVQVPAGSPAYGGRLKIFFHEALPILLGVKYQSSGAHVGGLVLEVVVFLVVGVTLLLCLLRRGATRLLAVSVIAFPFLYAYSPSTWYWQDGRYAVYLWPLLSLTLVAGGQLAVEGAPRATAGSRRLTAPARLAGTRLAGTRLVVAVGAVAFTCLCLVMFFEFYLPGGPSAFGEAWSEPDRPAVQTAQALAHRGARSGIANYWLAYKEDYLSGGTLGYSPPPWDASRNTRLYRGALHRRPQAWLFIAPSAASAGQAQFGVTVAMSGPPGLTEAAFRSALDRLGDPYRVRRVGLLDVVTPQRNVSVGSSLTVTPVSNRGG